MGLSALRRSGLLILLLLLPSCNSMPDKSESPCCRSECATMSSRRSEPSFRWVGFAAQGVAFLAAAYQARGK